MPTPLPPQVQAGLEAAEALEAELAQAGTPPQSDPPADPPAAPPQEPPAAPPPAAPDPMEQRYRTLQGMYDTDVKAVRATNAQLTDQVAALTRELDALKKAPPAPAPSPGTTPKGITPEDVEAFGQDLVDVIDRVAQNRAHELTAALQAQVEQLREQTTAVTSTVDKVAKTHDGQVQDQFLTKLTELVPDWQTVNTDPAFLTWCGASNPLTGGTNQDLLDAAAGAKDPARVSAIFAAFKATQPTPPAPPAQDPAAKSELESQIAPGTTPPSAPSTAPNSADKVWSARDIEVFYTSVTRGDYKGREAEAQAIEQQIDLAIQAGRVK